MIAGKMVKIRFKRYFAEQRQWIFLGKVLKFTDNWVTVEGKGIVIFKGRPNPVDVDRDRRVLLIPREHIAHIRMLPDDFDVGKINTKISKFRMYVKVEGGPDTSIGE